MIFVVGCARSGTSLITRMLGACGANLGETTDRAEHKTFKKKVLKPYLVRIGADPLGQHPLPDVGNLPEYPSLREDVMRAVGDVGVIKDVKTALVWPRMVEAFPDAKWVIVYRSPKAIAKSCMGAPFMRRHQCETAWESWARQYHTRCNELAHAADTHTVVASDVIGDVEQLRITSDWLGLDFDPKAVAKLVRKSKWHGG